MSHWVIAPVLLPAFTAYLLVLLYKRPAGLQRFVSLASAVALWLICFQLFLSANADHYEIYKLGNWDMPFGIVLVLDRLSAFMILLTSTLAACCLIYATQHWDTKGQHFHALFHLQLMGVNGAFLTGDIFNLFVFFEILLIASYSLLLYGGTQERIRASVHYVIYNLVGSSLFLIAVGTLYAMTGTLNMADMAIKLVQLEGDRVVIAQAAALLLMVVFSIKAAILPLYFWLPATYGAASGPVAALFAIMTKVGVYSIIRVFTLMFGEQAGEFANLGLAFMLPLALATMVLGVLGALAAHSLTGQICYLVIVSVGMMLTGFASGSEAALSATLFYMANSTLIIAALFLLAEQIAEQRGKQHDFLSYGFKVSQPALLGTLFFVGAAAVAGLPPFAGFMGKILMLQATHTHAWQWLIWGVILVSGLLTLISLARSGSTLFWKSQEATPTSTIKLNAISGSSVVILIGLVVLLSLAGDFFVNYTDAMAAQLKEPGRYVHAVLYGERP